MPTEEDIRLAALLSHHRTIIMLFWLTVHGPSSLFLQVFFLHHLAVAYPVCVFFFFSLLFHLPLLCCFVSCVTVGPSSSFSVHWSILLSSSFLLLELYSSCSALGIQSLSSTSASVPTKSFMSVKLLIALTFVSSTSVSECIVFPLFLASMHC